jgi:NADPH-dependent 2,4-dienoyl-CoA reductase/sulfur reductase-like enzyme
MHLVVIGGSDAGISAALRAQELKAGAEITVLVADGYPNFSICGLPYFLSGETPDWRALAHRTEFPGLNILRRHSAQRIDASNRTVSLVHAGAETTMRYDRLVIATGAKPVTPELPGSKCEGVFLLHTMDDSFAVHRFLTERKPCTAVLVGAGYIGLEMADALTQRGLDVTLLCRAETLLPTVDPALGRLVQEELERHGVRVLTGVSAAEINQTATGRRSRLSIVDSAGSKHEADLALLAVGARPDSALAEQAGAKLGAQGAIIVTRQMRTNLPDVFGAGDCVETYHRLLEAPTYISLGTIAHKQGRVAGENAIGGDRMFAGALGTQSLKVFDLAIARTGVSERDARQAGFDPVTVGLEANDHKAYYPGAVPLRIHLTGDRRTGRLLGGQILGNRRAEISKRIDIIATAIFKTRASTISTISILATLRRSAAHGIRSKWRPRLGARNSPSSLVRFKREGTRLAHRQRVDAVQKILSARTGEPT